MSEQDVDTTAEHADVRSSVLAICSITAFVIALILSAAVFFTIIGVGESFQAMFHEMGAELPLATTIVISPMFWQILLVLAAGGVLKEFLIRDRLITLAINGLHLCLVVALTNFCMLALFLPLIKLMETMGQG